MKLFGYDLSLRKLSAGQYDPAQTYIDRMRSLLTAGISSTAGASINDDSVLSLSTYFACCKVIAEDTATTPIITYRRTGERTRQRETELRLYRLLHDLPNPEMTAFAFKEMLAYQMLLPSGGFAAAEIERDDYGNVKYLWPLLSKDVEMRRDPSSKALYFRVYNPGDRIYTDLPAYNVLYIPGMTTTGLNGRAPGAVAANVAGLSLALEKFAALHFSTGGFLKDYLKAPGALSDAAFKNMAESWEARHGSLDHAGRIAILEQGTEYVAVMAELAKVMPPDVRAQQVIEVCRLFRMQPNKVQEYGRATWSNAEQMNTSHYTDCLLPWFTRWEQALLWKLPRATQSDLFFEFLADNWLRGDYETRMKGYGIAIDKGIMTRNEVRALENQPPIDGGDELFVPMNMAPLSKVISGEIQPDGKAPGGANQ